MIKTNQNLLGQYVIVRSNLSGVHLGILVDSIMATEGDDKVTLINSRRLWKSLGPKDCSELATVGLKHSDENSISVPVEQMSCVSCETIKASKRAVDSILAHKFFISEPNVSDEITKDVLSTFKDYEEFSGLVFSYEQED